MDDAVHDEVHDDRLEDMIRSVGIGSFVEAHGYNFTRLLAVLYNNHHLYPSLRLCIIIFDFRYTLRL